MSTVLLCSTPVHGHVTPLLAVTRHLSKNGHRVRFLSGQKYREAIEAAGAEFLPLPVDADYDDADMDAAFPERVGLTGPAGIRYDVSAIFMRPALSQLSAVKAALSAEPTDSVRRTGSLPRSNAADTSSPSCRSISLGQRAASRGPSTRS